MKQQYAHVLKSERHEPLRARDANARLKRLLAELALGTMSMHEVRGKKA